MKYIIDVPKEIAKISEEFLSKAGLLCEPYTEPDRKAIEDEVWELTRRIICPSDCCEDSISAHTKEIFNKEGWEIRGIFNDLSYQEAKAKYEAWMKQKDETFNTGDEVYNKEIDSKGVILRRYNSDTLDILWDDGSAGETMSIKAITKTGRHFNEVAELLQKMRGVEE